MLARLSLLLALTAAPVRADDGQAEADAATLKKAGLKDNGSALLDYFRKRIVRPDDRKKIAALIEKMGAYSFRERVAATYDIRSFGLAAIGPLRVAAGLKNPEVARRARRALAYIEKVPSPELSEAAARRLAFHKPDGTAEALLNFLPMADEVMVREAIQTALNSVAVRGDEANPVIVRALTSEGEPARTAAAVALVRGGAKAQLPRVRRMLGDSKGYDFRSEVALALATSQADKAAVPVMIDLLAEAPDGRGWRLEEVLFRLAGDDAPKATLGSDQKSRTAARDAWRAWWAKNKAKADMAALSRGPTVLGYTLICDTQGNAGEVYELDAQKRVRWKLTGFRSPVAAAMLPGSRVLVADRSASQVQIRDLRGKTLWTQSVYSANSVQRLPNGNLFVAGRNDIFEYTPDRKQVFTFKRGRYDMVASVKTRDGKIVFLTNRGELVRLDPKTKKQEASFNVGQVYYYGGLRASGPSKVIATLQSGVAEFDTRTGRRIGPVLPANRPLSVQKLYSGNVLVCESGGRVAEFSRPGKAVWEHKPGRGSFPWYALRR